MKYNFTLAVLLILLVSVVHGQTTRTVGTTGAYYPKLKSAFDAINSGAIQGQIVLQIIDNTVEDVAVPKLAASGTGAANYTSILIYPTGTRSISSNYNGAVIDLDGADNVTIDGRINQTGTPNSLTISGTSTGTGASVLRFLNSAENNTIKYCNLQGSSTSSMMGIIFFAASNVGNGNDNNIIEYCTLTCSGANRPYNAILSSGTSGRDNSGNIIRNNNIYNTFQTGKSSNGINIGSASIGFTISGNSIYETTEFAATANALSYYAIRVGTTSEHTISGNYIGGSGPFCTGTWSFTAHYAVYYCGIYAYAGTSTATTISNNVISNMDYKSTEDNPWDGIFLYSGNFDVTGNTIGATTGTGSITLTTPVAVATTTLAANPGGISTTITVLNGGSGYVTAPIVTFSNPPAGGTLPTATANLTGGSVTSITVLTQGSGYINAPAVIFDGQSNNYSTSHGMIQNSTGTINITGNNIGSITTVGSDYYSHGFESIYVRGVAATTIISNNLIGSRETANSINVSSTAASSLLKQDVYGIYSSGTLSTIITGNTVANLTNAYAGINSQSRNRGIQTVSGSNTITNNIVRDLTSFSKQSSGGSAASAIGISQTSTTAGTTQTISGNTVYIIKNTNPTEKSLIRGIYYNGPASGSHTIYGNFVHSLSIVSSNNNSDITGIELAGGTYTCANNIVNLGVGIAGGYIINGIWDESGSTITRSVYFNSVYIGGTVNSGSSTSVALKNEYSGIRNYRNNVLLNARTSTTGKHYAYYVRYIEQTGLTSDYNDYWTGSTETTVIVASMGGVDKTLNTLKTATGGDTHSLQINPSFASAGGTSALNYATSAILPGITETGITTDYSGLTRPATPKLGALETNEYVWYGSVSSMDYNTAANWLPAEVPPAGADIAFATTPLNNCVLDQNRTIGNISNAQSSYKFVVNGNQLTINKNLIFTNGAQMDATAASSVVVFAGTSAQSIPTGAFYNNTIDGLTVNNSNGLTLNGDLTVAQTLALTNGNFSLGSNTLTLNGTITPISGTLTGGATSNLVLEGMASTSLPAITLNNLTLNRSGGISLGGNVNVAGTLALTSGVLTVGGNTLTISGSSPTSSGGTVDASNASANLVFANTSAIALPATFFTNAVNNLTLNGIGGVTAGSNISVTGVLNLVTANPSATKGLLEMTINYTNYPGTLVTQYLNSYRLNMGENATTTGIGDVTGTVKRTTINANTPYSFGNQYTTVSLTPGTMPDTLLVTITIGSSPNNTKKSDDIINDAAKRTYEIVPKGGSDCYVTANFHYLHSELTSSNSPYHVNTEQKLTTMDYDIEGGYDYSDEHGRANYDYINNYIGLSSVPISYFMHYVSDPKWRTIFALRDYGVNYFTWNGSTSTDWNTATNWTLPYSGSGIPTPLSHVIIPDVATTNNRSPILPSGNTTINTISIENGGVLTMGNNTLTLQNSFSGGWEDQNPLGNDPGTSTVVFDLPPSYSILPHTTISGNARFYNVEIADGAEITNQAGSTMKIAGSITRTGLGTGKWYSDIFDATVEYNGGVQTVIATDGSPSYHNLILSGSGIKTMPASALNLHGNLTLAGTASATASGNMVIGGNLNIATGTAFGTGAFTQEINGDIVCDGTFTATSGSSLTMNGSFAQSVGGTTSAIAFQDLTIANTSGVTLFNHTTTQALSITEGDLTVIAGKSLTATGNTTITPAQGLVLKSDATGTASFIDNGTITGTARIERYLTPYDEVTDLKFHYIASPLSSSQAIAPEFIVVSSPAITDFYKWDEPTNYWINFRGASYNSQNTSFGDSYNFVQGKGYMVAYPEEVIKNFIGTPSTGPLTVNCSHASGGWNLIGNPYPSSINWEGVTLGTGMDAALYYYDNSVPGYKYYTYFSGGLGGASPYIAPMQGFMVHASSAGSVGMTNAARTHEGQDVFYKSASLASNILDLKVEGNDKTDYARICFYDQATENFDGDFDAYKLFSYSEIASELYTLSNNNTSLAINTLPETVMEGGSVPVSFKVGLPGKYTITAEKINSFAAGTTIILEDKTTNTEQNLNENPVYSFIANAKDDADRFVLHFTTFTSVPQNKDENTFNVSISNGVVKVNTAISGATGKIKITDMTGRTIATKNLATSAPTLINLNVKPGVYLVSVYSSGTVYSRKVVVY